jgi:hypothetical protein
MKPRIFGATVPLVVLLASLAACGGGDDDEAGSPTALSVVPSTLTLTALQASAGGPPQGQCGGGMAGTVFVYGGAAPYRLDNTSPDLVTLNKSTVDSRGGSFTVTYIGGCFSPVSIVIVDKLDNQVVLELNNKPADAATTP